VLAYADYLRDIEKMITEDPFGIHGLAIFYI